MLSSISWQQYFTWLIIITLLYYVFVWVVYFKARIPSLSVLSINNTIHDEEQSEEMRGAAQQVMEELKNVFSKHQHKEELIFSIQQRLKKYNQWDEPGFRETINEFIAEESETKCSIHLSEEDQRVLWKG